MAEQPQKTNSGEIDLGQLIQIIGNWFDKLGIGFLRLFLFIKKRVLVLGGLTILGLGIGFGLNQITEKKKKIEVIVKPNMNSENYLYDVVGEIKSNLKGKDTAFFKSIGISVEKLEQFEISVEPIEVSKNRKGDLELFEKFKENPLLANLIKSELEKNSALNHRIRFTFRNTQEGLIFAKKVMEYINSADFFKELVSISNENAKIRIQQNQQLIEQVDILIKNYSESLREGEVQPLEGRIQLDNEKPIDITGLLELKNGLIQNTEQKRIELQTQVEPINVLNFGKPQEVIRSFFGKSLVLIPTLLLAGYFMIVFLGFLNQRAKQLK